jgi:hypothetical protein
MSNKNFFLFLFLTLLVCLLTACPKRNEGTIQEGQLKQQTKKEAAVPVSTPDETWLYTSLTKSLPDATAEAVLVDGLVFFSLYLAGIASPITIPYAILSSTVGYSFRKVCNIYFSSESARKKDPDLYEYGSKALCGSIGGALKYGIKSFTLAPSVLLRGAINNALYEIFSRDLKRNLEEHEHLSFDGKILAFESVDGVLEFSFPQNEERKFSVFTTGVLAGLLVAAYEQTAGNYYKKPFVEWLNWVFESKPTKPVEDEL